MKDLKPYVHGLAQVVLNWPSPLLIIDGKLQIHYANDTASLQFGYDRNELMNSNLNDSIQYRYRAALKQNISNLLKEGKHSKGKRFLTTIVMKNGLICPVTAAIGQVLKDDDTVHALVRFEELPQNISKEKMLEKQLEDAAISTESINALDLMDDSVVIFDNKWRYQFLNQVGWDVMGRDRDEVLGKNVWELMPHLRNTEFKRVAYLAMKTQKKYQIEEFYPHRQKWYVTKFYPSSLALTTQMIDVTEMRQAQNINKQLLGDYKQAMEVYWSEENKDKREKTVKD